MSGAMRPDTIGWMEIRMILDETEPLVGRLCVVRPSPGADGCLDGEPVSFTGWLGLLRALYRVTGTPVERPPAEP